MKVSTLGQRSLGIFTARSTTRAAVAMRGGLAALALLATVAGCDDKKEEASRPAPSAAAVPAPEPVKEVAPVEEAPTKKEPRVCPPGMKVADFAGNAPLEAEVRRKLQKETGDITVAELGKVRSLNLSQVRVDELDACIFPYFKGAKEIFLGAGKLDDLRPLAGLTKLESLRASLNKVEDLKPLTNLVKMDRLDLGGTQVKDLTPLAGLTAMTELALDGTPVTDVAPLASCTKLERLSLKRTGVKNLAPLRTLTSLKSLDITDTPVDDKFVLQPLVGPKGLKIVD
jgi:internalin A